MAATTADEHSKTPRGPHMSTGRRGHVGFLRRPATTMIAVADDDGDDDCTGGGAAV